MGRRRYVGVVAATVLSLVVAAVPASAQSGPVRAPAAICPTPPDAAPSSPSGFRDVTDGVHADGIACLASWGLVQGFDDGTFRPGQHLDRGQFASILARLAAVTDAPLPPGTPGGLSDVAGTFHEPAITALHEAGIVDGFEDGTFGPRRTLTRGQAASLLVALHRHVRGEDLPTGPSPFTDTAGSVHEDAIAALAAAGVAAGRPDGRFDVQEPVSRGQVATLVARLLVLVAPEEPDEPEEPPVEVGTFDVDGAVEHPSTLTVDDLRAFESSDEVTVEYLSSGSLVERTFEGPLLHEVLESLGPRFADEPRNDQLRHAVLATATDGYRATVAWGEIDPGFAGTEVRLAYEEDGEPLDQPRLVVPGDERGGRYVTGVERISLLPVAHTGSVAPDPEEPGSFVVDGAFAESVTLELDDLRGFDEHVVEVEFLSGGTPSQREFRGALLHEVLESLGPQFADEPRNDHLRHAVLATAPADGYRAAVAWGEIDPGFAGTQVLLAYEEDGEALDQPRLVVPGDARGGRYVTGVGRISLLPVAPTDD